MIRKIKRINKDEDVTKLIKEITRYNIRNITVRDLFNSVKKGYVVVEYEN